MFQSMISIIYRLLLSMFENNHEMIQFYCVEFHFVSEQNFIQIVSFEIFDCNNKHNESHQMIQKFQHVRHFSMIFIAQLFTNYVHKFDCFFSKIIVFERTDIFVHDVVKIKHLIKKKNILKKIFVNRFSKFRFFSLSLFSSTMSTNCKFDDIFAFVSFVSMTFVVSIFDFSASWFDVSFEIFVLTIFSMTIHFFWRDKNIWFDSKNTSFEKSFEKLIVNLFDLKNDNFCENLWSSKNDEKKNTFWICFILWLIFDVFEWKIVKLYWQIFSNVLNLMRIVKIMKKNKLKSTKFRVKFSSISIFVVKKKIIFMLNKMYIQTADINSNRRY